MKWNILRGYTSRVKSIHQFSSVSRSLDPNFLTELFTLSPFGRAYPLFSNLQSLLLEDCVTLPVVHVAVESLTTLLLDFTHTSPDSLVVLEILDAFGECCPNMRTVRVDHLSPGPLNTAISRQVFRWRNLWCLDCT